MIVYPAIALLHAIFLPLGLGLFFLWIASRDVSNKLTGSCGDCGYDLRGQRVHPATCPECGAVERPMPAETRRSRLARQACLGLAIACIAIPFLADAMVIGLLMYFLWNGITP